MFQKMGPDGVLQLMRITLLILTGMVYNGCWLDSLSDGWTLISGGLLHFFSNMLKHAWDFILHALWPWERLMITSLNVVCGWCNERGVDGSLLKAIQSLHRQSKSSGCNASHKLDQPSESPCQGCPALLALFIHFKGRISEGKWFGYLRFWSWSL